MVKQKKKNGNKTPADKKENTHGTTASAHLSDNQTNKKKFLKKILNIEREKSGDNLFL